MLRAVAELGSSIFFSQKPISEYPQAKHYTAVGIVTPPLMNKFLSVHECV